MRRLTTILAAIALSACAGQPPGYERIDGTPGNLAWLDRDAAQCEYEAMQTAAVARPPANVGHYNSPHMAAAARSIVGAGNTSHLVDACLRARGWNRFQ